MFAKYCLSSSLPNLSPALLTSLNLLSNSAAANPILDKEPWANPASFSISLSVKTPCGFILKVLVLSSKYVNCFDMFAKLSCKPDGSLIDWFINWNGSANAPADTPNLWNAAAVSMAPSGDNTFSAKANVLDISNLNIEA